MASRLDQLMDRLVFRRALARWRQAAGRAESAGLGTLRRLRGPARQLRRELDRFLHVAEGRLALPAIDANAIRKPLMSDWVWRPEIWRGPISPPGMAAVQNRATFGSEATIFHDCSRSELTIRQIRNARESDLAPFGFRMDVFRFDGSFLSLVVDLPDEAVRDLTQRHLIRMDTTVELEKPLEIFARLNVRHGPNTEQLVRELPLGSDEVHVEFDLAYSRMNEKRVERAWIDLIFEGPEMNQIVLRDVTFSRRPRAEI
ncbi:MAG: DUF6478 family protein [Paracoccaceae bacterium]